MSIQIQEPGERIKKLALVNKWHHALLSRALAVIGPNKNEDEVLQALQEAADNINLASLRGSYRDNEALKLKGVKVFGYSSVADFDKACKRPYSGVLPDKYPLASDACSEPPASCQPCDLKVGDVVTFTNDYGAVFPNRVITGFASVAEHGRFVYYDSDSWWFPVSPESLTRQAPEVEQSPATLATPEQVQAPKRKFTYGDGVAAMILVASRMGIETSHIQEAGRRLAGETVHVMISKQMADEACRLNNSLLHDASLMAQANEIAEQIKIEYGFLPPEGQGQEPDSSPQCDDAPTA